jgi:putative transposase
MPRTARMDLPGLLQHVIVRGIEKRDIFLGDRDRKDLRNRLSKLLQEMEIRCFAWSFMPNHFHLLLKPARYPLSFFMRRLLSGHAVAFNLRHQRSGHLFQNRYKSIACEEDPYLLELIRYIHLNPLRAGLVNDLKTLDDYPWCGHAVLMGKQEMEGQEIKEVLQYFGQSLNSSRRGYREFLREGIKDGRRSDLVGGGMIRSQRIQGGSSRGNPESFDARVLGSGEFVENLWQREELRNKLRKVLSLPQLVSRVSVILSLEEKEVRRPSKDRRLAQGRGIICYLAVREFGYKGFEVGRELCLGPAGVSLGLRRAELLFREQPEMKKKLILELEK